jgi:hypothetical protein
MVAQCVIGEPAKINEEATLTAKYSWVWAARPDPAQKWPGPSGQSMLSGMA